MHMNLWLSWCRRFGDWIPRCFGAMVLQYDGACVRVSDLFVSTFQGKHNNKEQCYEFSRVFSWFVRPVDAIHCFSYCSYTSIVQTPDIEWQSVFSGEHFNFYELQKYGLNGFS